MLNVLHISHNDNQGGSARSAYRIHNALRKSGAKSRMFVGWKHCEDEDVRMIGGNGLWYLDRLSAEVMNLISLQSLFCPSSYVLPFRRWFREADIVQLYNVHGGYFTHTILPVLSRQKPIIWRLSDMWPLTGHCTYSLDCQRWVTGCGSCPILSDYPALTMDTTSFLWKIKRWLYDRSLLTIVSPSKWLAGFAKQSPLTGRFDIHVIPNGVDQGIFRPIPKESAREALGLKKSGRVILFSAHSVTESRKGASFVKEALKRLAAKDSAETALLIVGSNANNLNLELPFPVRSLEYTTSGEIMALAYSAADVFLFPALAENFPNAILESMACGTPVIAFNVGGCPEIIRHMKTGYLAASQNADDLFQGLERVTKDKSLRTQMSRECLMIVRREYSLDLEAKSFMNLYENLMAFKPV